MHRETSPCGSEERPPAVARDGGGGGWVFVQTDEKDEKRPGQFQSQYLHHVASENGGTRNRSVSRFGGVRVIDNWIATALPHYKSMRGSPLVLKRLPREVLVAACCPTRSQEVELMALSSFAQPHASLSLRLYRTSMCHRPASMWAG